MKFGKTHLTLACPTVCLAAIVIAAAAAAAHAQESQPRIHGTLPYVHSVPLQSSAIPRPPRRLAQQNGLYPPAHALGPHHRADARASGSGSVALAGRAAPCTRTWLRSCSAKTPLA